VLEQVLVHTLHEIDTARNKTNVKRVEAMQSAMQSSAARQVADEFEAYVLSHLDSLEDDFRTDVIGTCIRLLDKLQKLDSEGLRALAASKVIEQSGGLARQLRVLTSAVMFNPNVRDWLEGNIERLRLTRELSEAVGISCPPTASGSSMVATSAAPPAMATSTGVSFECPRCRRCDFRSGSFLVRDTGNETCLICFDCYRGLSSAGANEEPDVA